MEKCEINLKQTEKEHWLDRRLIEIGRSQADLARAIGVNAARLSDLKRNIWSFQTSQINKAADFLGFDSRVFVDFLGGIASEETLWASSGDKWYRESVLRDVMLGLDSWARREKIKLEDVDRINLYFILYAGIQDAAPEHRIAEVVRLADFMRKNPWKK